MKQTIGACVVTYNRKDLLIRCLNAILRQEYLPDGIVIVDNVSTDSTFEEITTRMFPGLIFRYENESGFVYEGDIIVANRSMSVVYIQKKVNDGGSGGFYAAMKEAFNRGYDWLWLMDDDGLPDRKELKELYNKSVEYHLQYANALVLDIKDPTHFSFGLSKGRLVYTVEDAKKKPVIEDVANPFNGTFVSREVIEKIGFIKKEMFIPALQNNKRYSLGIHRRQRYEVERFISLCDFVFNYSFSFPSSHCRCLFPYGFGQSTLCPTTTDCGP